MDGVRASVWTRTAVWGLPGAGLGGQRGESEDNCNSINNEIQLKNSPMLATL